MPALVSLVAIVYNVEKLLPHFLECVGSQTYPCLEVILVDDGSTDSSGAICDAWALGRDNCKVLHQENAGIALARNAGIDASTGDYIFLPDSDDYFRFDLIQRLIGALEEHPESSFSMCRRKITSSLEEVVSPLPEAELPNCKVMERKELMQELFNYADSLCVFSWNKLYRRSCFDSLRLRPYKMSQDWDFNFRLFLTLDSAVLVDQDLYYWVQREGSMTHVKESLPTYFSCRTGILYRNLSELPDGYDFERGLLLKHLYRKMVQWKAKAGKWDKSRTVNETINRYRKTTMREYMSCRSIALYERVLMLFLLRFPSLTTVLLKVSGNM